MNPNSHPYSYPYPNPNSKPGEDTVLDELMDLDAILSEATSECNYIMGFSPTAFSPYSSDTLLSFPLFSSSPPPFLDSPRGINPYSLSPGFSSPIIQPSVDSNPNYNIKEQISDISLHSLHRIPISGPMNVSSSSQVINHRHLPQEGLMEDAVSEAIDRESRLCVTDVIEAKKTKLKFPYSSYQPQEKHITTWNDSALGNLSFTDRIKLALTNYLHLSGNGILVQVWVPQKHEERVFLSTYRQLSLLHKPTNDSLSKYREISNNYKFSVEQDDPVALPGLPGRVFLKKLPEWTPNVQFYSKSEYLRVEDAVHFGIRGSLALPVVEKGSGRCVAVLELVMSKEQLEYKNEIESVCEALNVM